MARGSKIRTTTKQLAAAEETKFKVKLKHWKRLKEQPEGTVRFKAKIKFKATDEFGQTATDELELHFGGPRSRSDH